jgi:hypothetical protein
VWPGNLAEQVFGEKTDSARLFLYMYRRFGPPVDTCDEYKVAAVYYLTTPRPDVFLNVSVYGGGITCLFFGYALSGDLVVGIRREEHDAEDAWRAEQAEWCRANGIAVPDRIDWVSATYEEVQEYHQKRTAAFDAYCAANPGKEDERRNFRSPLRAAVEDALLVTIRDFERPTYIRDVYFNPSGEVDDAAFEVVDDNYAASEEYAPLRYKDIPVAEYFRQK